MRRGDRGEYTCDGQVADQVIRVWGSEPVFQVHIIEFAANDWSHVEGGVLVEDA
jgi:hypothetical protein